MSGAGQFTWDGAQHAAVSGTIYSHTGSLGSFLILPESAARAGLVIYNGTDQDAYIAFGSRASAGSLYTMKLSSGSLHVSGEPIWAGNVSITWTNKPSTGSLQVTELV